MSWFGFLFPATGIFLSPHISIILPDLLPHVFFPPCLVFPQRIIQVTVSVFFPLIPSIHIDSLKSVNYNPRDTGRLRHVAVARARLQDSLMLGPCGPHLSYECEICMSACITALGRDIDSITLALREDV